MKKIIRCIFILLLAVCLPSCARFFTLKKEIAQLEKSYYLSGKLDSESQTTLPVWVFVWEKNEHGVITMTDVKAMGSGGAFVIMLPPGDSYHIGATEDANDNKKYDPGERIWVHGNPSPVEFRDGKSEILDIHLSEKVSLPEEDFRGLAKAQKGRKYIELKGSGQIPIHIGELADLDNPMFSPEMAEKGLWEPASFMNDIGLGIYFLTEYNPDKIPILFVHGAGGTPQNWNYILKWLDDRTYQKWVFYYPSGIRLNDSANVLNKIIQELQNKYQFKELYVIAHSMGGLVSRSFIIKNRIEGGNGYITKFVTIATPWGGHEAAALGVKRAPAVIPSWLDMQVNSLFIDELLEHKIGDKLDYYLLFTFQGNNSTFLPASNDGVVSLASQLAPRAQREAKNLFGFDKNHMSVLLDDDVIRTLENILMKHP